MGTNYDGQVDSNDRAGYGNMHGKIASPQGPCGYDVEPGGGKSKKGGEPNGPFGQHLQSNSPLPIVGRDGMSANPTIQGGISTPMDTSNAMPGVTGNSSGTGPTGGGGAKISSPFVSPWGDMVG